MAEHDHHHHHAPVEQAPADPAQQALADALRVSFGILKYLMAVLVVIYLFSGVYQVQPQEQAVQLVFGKVTGDTVEEQVKEAGWHLGWPFPVGEVVKVPTTTQNLTVADTFMFEIAERDRGKSFDEMAGGRALNPERDGSLITADANLVHGVFNASYTITNAARFIRNVGDPADAEDQERLRALLRTALERAVVHATAQTRSDEFIGGRPNRSLIKQLAQDQLDEAGAGVTLGEVTLNQPTMPLAVRDAYNLVSRAENTRSERINQAQTQRRESLGGVAGAAALPVAGGNDGPLVELIKRYELAAAGETDEAEALQLRLDEVFRTLRVEYDGQPYDVGGEAAAIINQAQTDRTTLVQTVRAEADAFRKLLENYRRDPALFRTLTWQQARSEIFGDGSDIETFMAPRGQLYLELNRDPEITRERERQRIEAEREARLAEQ